MLAHPKILSCIETKDSVLPETHFLKIKRTTRTTAADSVELSLCACRLWPEETPGPCSAVMLWRGLAPEIQPFC